MSERYRLAFVSGRYYPWVGGIESHIEQIARLLVRDGHSVEVLTQRDDRSWPRVEQIEGVLVRRFTVPIPSHDLAVAPELWRQLLRRRHEFDVIHAHGYQSFAPLAAACAGCQPLVFTPHYHGRGHSPFRNLLHKPYRRLGAFVVGRSDRIICVAGAEAQLFASHFPFASDRITVVPNGVDRELIEAAEPTQLAGRLVMGGGRLESYKHIERTVAAVAQLPDEFTLALTGDGPERKRLENMAIELGQQNRIKFLGRLDVAELYRWYRRADVYVTMSTYEAMPVTVVEMLAAGARVIASDIPAHRDIAERTRGAVTIVPVDVAAADLGSAIRSAAEALPASDQEVPTWREVADATLAVYREALKR
jgi:glycosyltransferase involved in cell wall biosynthesis